MAARDSLRRHSRRRSAEVVEFACRGRGRKQGCSGRRASRFRALSSLTSPLHSPTFRCRNSTHAPALDAVASEGFRFLTAIHLIGFQDAQLRHAQGASDLLSACTGWGIFDRYLETRSPLIRCRTIRLSRSGHKDSPRDVVSGIPVWIRTGPRRPMRDETPLPRRPIPTRIHLEDPDSLRTPRWRPATALRIHIARKLDSPNGRGVDSAHARQGRRNSADGAWREHRSDSSAPLVGS